MAFIGGGLFFVGFDVSLTDGVLGTLAKNGFSDVARAGWFVSATFLGMTIGAYVAGYLGDRFGRRFTFGANLALVGVASLIAACSPNVIFLVVVRFFISIGLGADVVVGYAMFCEFVPAAVRGRYLGLLAIPALSAPFVASVDGLFVLPVFGWRSMFAIAGVGALVVWCLRETVPESPRWLESRGRDGEAERVLRAIEAETGAAPFVLASADRPRVPSSGGPVFGRAPILRSAVGSVAIVSLSAAIYGFFMWIPLFFVREGFSVVESTGFSTLMTFGGPVGAVIALTTADRFGRKCAIVAGATIAAALGACYSFFGIGASIAPIGFLLIVTISANVVLVIAVYVPESFPTRVRSTGAGFCNGMGGLANLLIPAVVISIFARYGFQGVVALMVSLLLAQALVVGVFGIEPSRRSLEELDPDAIGVPAAAGPAIG